MAKAIGIIAYGTAEDRKKLEALAKFAGQSGSAWIIERIRREHALIYGELPPEKPVERQE